LHGTILAVSIAASPFEIIYFFTEETGTRNLLERLLV